MALSKKQQMFVESYLTCLNATQAAIRAGYSRRSAASIGSENLTKPEIKAAVDARLAEAKIEADEVLAMLSDHARGTMGDFMIFDKGGNASLNFKGSEDRLHLIKKLKQTRRTFQIFDADGEPKDVVEDVVEIELHDPQAALVQLGRYHKLWTDKVEMTDWRKEMEAAGLNPDAERDKLIHEYEETLAGGAGSAAAGSVAGGESPTRGDQAD